ncbi:MAG: hypothetical protein ACP5PT_02670 [Brevinematia bacterium]
MKKTQYIYFLLFLSGFASLLYQVLFSRLLNITFGLFIHSTVIVISTYMIGLALGYYISKFIKSNNNLLFYGYLELLVGTYSIFILLIFPLIDLFFVNIGNNSILKAFFSILILILPTTSMGITIPILIDYLNSKENSNLTDRIYGVNALGGALGALLSSVLFINLLGLKLTFSIAFFINLFIFISTLFLSKDFRITLSWQNRKIYFKNIGFAFIFIVLIFGFNGMALEIIWYRLLVYMVSNNTFSFSIILSSVIIGIAVGSLMYRVLYKILKSDFNIIVFTSIFSGIWVMFSIYILNSSYSLVGTIYNIFGNVFFGIFGDNNFSEKITLFITRYLISVITAGIIALSSGIIIPVVFNLVRGSLSENIDDQSISGIILAWNTVGSILGVFLSTYFLIPTFGFSNSLLIVALLYIVNIFLVMFAIGCNRIVGVVSSLLIFVMLILPKEITFTKYYNGFLGIKGDLKFYKEGLYGTVAVFDVNNNRFLKINGIDEVPDDFNSLISFKTLGNIAFLIKNDATNILVNALGGGITLSSALYHVSKNQNITVVDICPDVKDALLLFSNHNYNVFEKTNWTFMEDDGKNFLKSYKGNFDIIIADATHPASSYSWMLFTREFYLSVYNKLNTNGIFVQWIPIHNLEVYDFVSILKTAKSVFNNSFLMITGLYTALVGKKGDLSVLEFKNKDFRDLKTIGIRSEEDIKSIVFLSPYLLDNLIKYEKGEILSDFRSSVEFAEFHRRIAENTRAKILKTILKYSAPIEIAKFTMIHPAIHYSMFQTKWALVDYFEKKHYDALKKIDLSESVYPNFYSPYLFSLIFPEFIDFVYRNGDYIKKTYGDNVYYELVNYISNKMAMIKNFK